MDDLTYVEDFSLDSEDEDETYEPAPKRRRGPNRNWLFAEKFASKEDAEKSIDAIWKKSSCTNTAEGYKVEYRCAAGKYRVNECPAGLYLLYHSTNMEVSSFRTTCEHENHDQDPKRGLSTEDKIFIKEKFEEGIRKPNAILTTFRLKKRAEPDKTKLTSYLRSLRLEKYGPASVSATEIRQWCNARKAVPDDEDEPFVLNYHVQAESSDPETQDLKIVMSSKRLLHLARKSDMFQTDGTYKLTWQGYPVLIIGTSDLDRVFHPFALSVCKGESTEDYTFLFHAVYNFNIEWKPTILLANGSEAITAAFINVFGPPRVRLSCYFHLIHNIEKYLKPLSKGGDSGRIRSDIQALQTSKDDRTFLCASRLFVEKWKEKHPEFTQYFKEQWLSKNSSWYEGAAIGYPATNNGLEATNAWIKNECTLRERLPVGQFLTNVVDLIVKWSKTRDPSSRNCTHFAEKPSIPLSLWTAGHQWALLNRKILQRSLPDGRRQFFTTSTDFAEPITTETLRAHQSNDGKWKSFDAFKKHNYSVWTITITCNPNNPSDATCTCPCYLKKVVCKHSIGMLIRQKIVEAPEEARSLPLGQKRKRGRPSRAKKALIIQ